MGRPLRSRRTLAAVAAVLLAASGLGVLLLTGDDPPPPPAAAAPPPVPVPRQPIVGHPPADRWEVAAAWVKPEVEEAVVYRELPEETDTGRGPASDVDHRGTARRSPTIADGATPEPAPPTPNVTPLTPIPSPGFSWGSYESEGAFVVQNPTLIGSPLVFLVVEERGEWVRVMVQARPNHQTGWIRRDDVELRRHNWHIEVNTTTNRMRVWQGDHLEIDTPVVAGTQYTPTPLGRYYINETQQQANSWGAYGSWILSTNGFSEVLERFSGTVPIFALHGTPYPETMGQDLSNGCVRLPNPVVEDMARRVPLGTPVDIVA